MALSRKLTALGPFFLRHLTTHHSRPYEQILKSISARNDIWLASQGEYMAWWSNRDRADLEIDVTDGSCRVRTSLENAVIEKYPGTFLDSLSIPCENTDFSGEVWISIDDSLSAGKKEILIEVLKREGILNFRIANEGEIFLSEADVGDVLENIEQTIRKRIVEEHVQAIRQIVVDKLAAHNLPLLRVWYHPQHNGTIYKAVFSPRFDVDRAITNLAHIRELEKRYGVSSTLYVRPFCPFYTAESIKELASQPWCSEIALHGEFATNARIFGNEFIAAKAEKSQLEKLVERPVLGISMHGGELVYNLSQNTDDAIQKAEFLYDTTPSNRYYYFPFKRRINGHLSSSYSFSCGLSDISLSPFRSSKTVVNGEVKKSFEDSFKLNSLTNTASQNHNQLLYEQTLAKMDEIYEQNGVFVLTLHPMYFGFFSYLSKPKNWTSLFKFLATYFR